MHCSSKGVADEENEEKIPNLWTKILSEVFSFFMKFNKLLSSFLCFVSLLLQLEGGEFFSQFIGLIYAYQHNGFGSLLRFNIDI